MSENHHSVLRFANEPLIRLDDHRVHDLLTDAPADYLSFVREALTQLASGAATVELPAKQIFADSDSSGSDFRIMPCVVRHGDRVRKTVKLVGTNIEQQVVAGKITVGKAFAIHARENFITHEFDACALSSARTGACVAMAAEQLCGERRRVNFIGAGRVAYYAARYLAALGGVDSIVLCDSNSARAASTADLLSRHSCGVSVTHAGISELAAADLLVIATDSRAPVYGPGDFAVRTVISVGADSEFQHELDPALAGDSSMFVDTMDSVRYGDLKAWIGHGLIEPGSLTDLLSLIRNGVERHADRRAVFVSTGSALFDNLSIGYLLERLRPPG